jgi:hypothetical protein
MAKIIKLDKQLELEPAEDWKIFLLIFLLLLS